MPTHYYKVKALARLRIVALNTSGQIPITGTVVFDSTAGIQSLAIKPKIRETGEETTTAIDGKLCIDSPAIYANAGATLTLGGCGINREMEAAFGWYRLAHVTNGGWDQIDNVDTPQTLIIASHKIPNSAQVIEEMWCVNAWRPEGDRAINGSDTQHMNWSGETFKVPTTLFGLFTPANAPAGEFVNWVSYWTGYTGDAWSRQTDVMNAPTYPAGSPATAPRLAKAT